MYATLTFKSTAESSLGDVVADIVKVLTGETVKANLSAEIVQAGTTIISTVPAGWTVEQNVSATDVVLKSEISDDNTKFKYIRIHGETLSNVKAVFGKLTPIGTLPPPAVLL